MCRNTRYSEFISKMTNFTYRKDIRASPQCELLRYQSVKHTIFHMVMMQKIDDTLQVFFNIITKCVSSDIRLNYFGFSV